MTLVAKMRLEARLQIWVRLDAPKQWPTKFSPLRNKDDKKRTDFPQLNLWHSSTSSFSSPLSKQGEESSQFIIAREQSHKAFLNKKSDLFFLCALTPRSYEIIEQKSEILEAKKNCEEDYLGFSTVETTTGTGKKSFVYCNADHAMSLNAARDQASSSH
ncbi:hypothetical protein F2Q70_00035412 [Brassica cretica]|uniref:Uncharacterized protein n=1 Tax=Brassica cretica TaxID=69181 RepID=A0A8S9JUP2_BRACR|nr:hypothetical protein F2Q70_00035412 [Brassica cretica]